MEIFDLRSFINALKNNNQLVEIKKQVNLKYELGRVLATLEKKNMGGALFTNIIQSDIPVVSGVLNSPGKVAIALQCSKNKIVERVATSFEQPIKPRIVQNGPCQEVEYFGESVDLSSLPIPLHAPHDSGHFITGGVVFSKSLDGETQNLSFQRMQVKGKNKLGIMINEWRHLKEFYDKAEKTGKSLPIAVAIGLDPVIMIAAGLRYEGDEIELAGALRGFPIEIVKCKTSNTYVPALAEIIIEGEILPGIREMEGPLGEFTGHYSEPWESPVLKVNCITHRKNPIYQTIAGASSEHLYLGSVLSREPILKKHVTYVSKNVTGVHILPCSGGFTAVISLDKRNPGEPKNVALAAMTAYVNIKNVIVVDSDVDIYNTADIIWALSTRVKPERDIFYIPNSQGHELDPCSDHRGVQTKMGIDATLAEENSGYRRVVYEEVNLDEYLDGF